jgi:hypothetical protein
MPPGRRVHAGGLSDFPAANSFAPWRRTPRETCRGTAGSPGRAPPSPRRQGRQSTQVDFVIFQRRIHSLPGGGRRGRSVAGRQGARGVHRPRPGDRAASPRRWTSCVCCGEFIRSARGCRTEPSRSRKGKHRSSQPLILPTSRRSTIPGAAPHPAEAHHPSPAVATSFAPTHQGPAPTRKPALVVIHPNDYQRAALPRTSIWMNGPCAPLSR